MSRGCYALLGRAVVASARLWAGLLDRDRGGQALAMLNTLLGVATLLPALTASWGVVLASGLLFGGVFLSVVASTTALVRHNLPQAQWAAGISAFTIVFAAGQIVGPTIVGWIADGPGGLSRGLVFSALALWAGALLAPAAAARLSRPKVPVHNASMKRLVKWIVIVFVLLLVLLAGGVLALKRWIGTDDFRQRLEQQAGAALGVPLSLGGIDVALWPLPAVVVERIAVQTQPALTVARVEVRPAWADLLQGKVAPATLVVRRAVLPQPGIDALLAAMDKAKRKDQDAAATPWQLLPQRTVLDGLTWIDAKGAALTVQAEARLSPDVWPQQLSAQIVQGRLQGAKLDLQREAQAHAWGVKLQVAGGSINGRLALQLPKEAGAEFTLKGQLKTQDVEVARLTAPAPTPTPTATSWSARRPWPRRRWPRLRVRAS